MGTAEHGAKDRSMGVRPRRRDPSPRPGQVPRTDPASAPEGLAARRAALVAFTAVLEARTPLDDALQAAFSDPRHARLDERDRRFARAVTVVAFRHFGAIELRLDCFLRRPLPKRAAAVRNILHIGLAQLDHMDVPDHAAVSLTVEMARADPVAAHFTKLVNGVMRAATRDRGPAPGRARTVPAWLWRRWRDTYGEEAARRIAATIAEGAALDLSVKECPDMWAERLGGTLLPTGTVRLTDRTAVEELPGYAEGAWWVQDAAAALPARLFGPIAGKTVLDLCAAPGGKTAQLAAAGAKVTALDVAPRRLALLKENLDRLGLAAETVAADVLDWSPGCLFDAILLDAPCSSTGTIRRHPDVPYARTEEDVSALARIQRAMLERAGRWLKPDGELIYSTCSLEPEEGVEPIAAFLAANADFRRRPVAAAEIGGLTDAVTAQGDVRTLPFMAFPGAGGPGLDGFFAARLVRSGPSATGPDRGAAPAPLGDL